MYKNSDAAIVWTGLLAIDWQNGMMLPRYQGNYSLLRCSWSAMNVSVTFRRNKYFSAMGRK